MAVTVAFDATTGRTTAFPNQIRRGTISLGTYAQDGVAVTRQMFELGSIDNLELFTAAGYVPEWDKTNSKIIVYWVDTSTDGAALAQVAGTPDLAAILFRFTATGR